MESRIGIFRSFYTHCKFSIQLEYRYTYLTKLFKICLVFADMTSLTLHDIDGSDDQDTLAPLASLQGGSTQMGWIGMPMQQQGMPMMQQGMQMMQPGMPMPQSGMMMSQPGGSQVGQIYPQGVPPPPSYSQVQQGYGLQGMPPPEVQFAQYAQFMAQHQGLISQAQSVSSGSGSQRSGSQKSSQQKEFDRETIRSSGSSERSAASSRLDKMDDKDRISLRDDISVSGSEMSLGRDLASVPSSISGSRQSFRMAMVNPANEFFVDVM